MKAMFLTFWVIITVIWILIALFGGLLTMSGPTSGLDPETSHKAMELATTWDNKPVLMALISFVLLPFGPPILLYIIGYLVAKSMQGGGNSQADRLSRPGPMAAQPQHYVPRRRL
jgi:Na+/melibiose symporter-like transporter